MMVVTELPMRWRVSVCCSILSPFSTLTADKQKTDTRQNSRGRFHQSLLAVQVAKLGETLHEKERLPTFSSQERQSLFQTADRRTHDSSGSPLARVSTA
jgi:hypothetical protein